MSLRAWITRFSGLIVLSLLAVGTIQADTLNKIVAASAQGNNDSIAWSQEGADGKILTASFSARTALGDTVTAGLAGPNSIVSVACSANPCSWTGTGFTAGHSLLWTSDAGNGSNGPVTLNFSKSIAGAGTYIQADMPGPFTAQIQLYNGSTSLGSYTMSSDNAGDPLYLGAVDETGANITSVVFSLTACASSCTDLALDTILVNEASAGPAVTLSPTSLSFATTSVGTTSSSQTVTLKNTGSGTLTISSILSTGTDASSFLIPSKTCGTSLAAGASCTFSVAFKPAAAGSLSAAIHVTDNAAGSPQSVSVSGTGKSTSLTVTLSPTSLSFATTPVGTTSSSQPVTLKNTGSGTLTISSILSTGTNASSFLIPSKTCGTSLAAGASCKFSVAFKPTASGSLSAAIHVTDNATGSPQSVSVSGKGAPLTATLSPTSLSFATTPVGTTSSSQTVTLKNTGSGTLTISSILSTGTNASSFLIPSKTCGTSLTAGASCTFSVAFKPAASGSLSAAIHVTDNATGSPQSVSVSGKGAPLTVTLSPTTLSFPSTKVGTTSTSQKVTLKNSGVGTLTISSILSTGTYASSFPITAKTCGTTLAAGTSCTISVAFKPQKASSLSAAIHVTDNATGSPQSVPVSGTGHN